MAQSCAVSLCFGGLPQIRKNIIPEEIELKIAVRRISEPVFKLKAGLRSEFELQKSVGNVISLIAVFSKSVRLKVKPAQAEGRLLVDSREDTFTGICAIFTGKAARLKINPIPVEEGIELVKGETCRTSSTD